MIEKLTKQEVEERLYANPALPLQLDDHSDSAALSVIQDYAQQDAASVDGEMNHIDEKVKWLLATTALLAPSSLALTSGNTGAPLCVGIAATFLFTVTLFLAIWYFAPSSRAIRGLRRVVGQSRTEADARRAVILDLDEMTRSNVGRTQFRVDAYRAMLRMAGLAVVLVVAGGTLRILAPARGESSGTAAFAVDTPSALPDQPTAITTTGDGPAHAADPARNAPAPMPTGTASAPAAAPGASGPPPSTSAIAGPMPSGGTSSPATTAAPVPSPPIPAPDAQPGGTAAPQVAPQPHARPPGGLPASLPGADAIP